MKKFLWVLPLVFLLTGCGGLLGSLGIETPSRPKTVYSWKEKQTREPVTNSEQMRSVNELEVNLDQGPEKLSFMQRIGRAISNMTIFTFIALVVAFFVTNGGVIGWILAKYRKIKENLELHKKAVTQITKAIDKAPADAWNGVKDPLAKETDADVKTLIAEAKNGTSS